MPPDPSNLPGPPPHTHSPIHPLTHSSPSPLTHSPSLASLLDEVTAPNADLDAIAQAHNLTRADLAAILESPEAQPLLAALRNLYTLHHEFQAYHHSLTLAHTLCEAARAATNPTDKRLAATAALRALYPSANRARSASECPDPPPQRGGGQVHAQHEPGGGASPHPRQPTKEAEREAEKEAEAERVPERSFGSPATPATPPTPPTPPTSPTPRATPTERASPTECATAVPAVRPQHPRPTHPHAPSPLNSLPSPPQASTLKPHASNLDRALNRRRPRIDALTRAGAPPDTS